MNAKRATGLFIACVVVGTSLVGCGALKKKKGDDDDLAALLDAATVGAAGLGAKNESSVLRYANETALANEPAVIGAGGAKARTFPGNGVEVATLAKGTPVAKIASYFSTGVLIMFDDPSGDGSKLMGWVPPKAFDTAAPAPAKVIVPPSLVKDAGAAPSSPKDAGVAVVDAGGGGSSLPQPPKGIPAVPAVNGKCPDNWVLNSDSMCRRKCNADPDCPRGTKCITKSGAKVCSSG